MTDEQKAKCHKIADHYGEEHQMLKAVEEMAELTQEIVKSTTGYSRQEWYYPSELADVLIMIEQLLYLYEKRYDAFGGRISKFIDSKLLRQLGRMEEENNG